MKIFTILRSVINLVFGFVIFFLGIRLLLKLFGASATAPFVGWIYETSRPLLNPFIGAFPTPRIEGGFVLEFTTLFAILVYLLINYLLLELIELIKKARKR